MPRPSSAVKRRGALAVPAWPGAIPDMLLGAAEQVRDAHPGDTMGIVAGSSSDAMHRVVGSVAVSLARRRRVPVVIVP